MQMKKYTYLCENCGEEWGFCPEDYEKEEDYPKRCPFCTMPVSQMISDVFKEEGFFGVIRMLYLRYLRQ